MHQAASTFDILLFIQNRIQFLSMFIELKVLSIQIIYTSLATVFLNK